MSQIFSVGHPGGLHARFEMSRTDDAPYGVLRLELNGHVLGDADGNVFLWSVVTLFESMLRRRQNYAREDLIEASAEIVWEAVHRLPCHRLASIEFLDFHDLRVVTSPTWIRFLWRGTSRDDSLTDVKVPISEFEVFVAELRKLHDGLRSRAPL